MAFVTKKKKNKSLDCTMIEFSNQSHKGKKLSEAAYVNELAYFLKISQMVIQINTVYKYYYNKFIKKSFSGRKFLYFTPRNLLLLPDL